MIGTFCQPWPTTGEVVKNRGTLHRAWGAAAVVLLIVLGACSGSGDDKDAATPTPTPTPTATTPAPQPEGADGVTYDVRNWSEHADDAPVLAWKQALEAASASANKKKVLPAFRADFTRRGFRTILPTITQAWPYGWTLPSQALVEVRSSTTSGRRATVVACLWGETTSYRTKQGAFVEVKGTRVWKRATSRLALEGGRWKVASYAIKGTCPLSRPS